MTNRNDPCPCGSGKKFKKCCMGKSGVATAAPARPVGKEHVRRLLETAMAHGAAGRIDEAAAVFESVLEERREEPDALYGMARIAQLRGDLPGALGYAQRAVAAAPARAHGHATLARIFEAMHRLDDALASARRAVALDAANVPARCVEAACQLKMNHIEAAMTVAREAATLASSDVNVSLLLARIETRAGDASAAIGRLEKLLASPGLDTFSRCVALQLAGTAYDRMGVWDDAFDAFTRCGAALAGTPAAIRADPSRSPRAVEAYRRGTTPQLLARWGAADLSDGSTPPPVFLVGFSRSGTTLTEQILAAHPLVRTSDEHEFLKTTIEEMGAMAPDADPLDVPGLIGKLTIDQARTLRDSYRERVRSTLGPVPDGGVYIDKLPLNLIKMPLIDALFPDARVIVATRDPRDVCLSCFMQWFNLNDANIHFLTIEGTAAYYAAVMDLWLHVRPMLRLQYEELRYEGLVRDLERSARRLLEFVGLEWHPQILAFHEKAQERVIRTPSAAAVTERVHTRAIGRWKNYERHLEPVLPVLQPFVEALGYAPE